MLFNSSDIDKEVKSSADKLSASSVTNTTKYLTQVRSRASDIIASIFGEIKQGNFIEFCSAGEFSTHQLLNHLLQITGTADVYISTWTLKEEPARLLYALKKSGVIRNLYFVFDYRIRTLDAKHFDFIEKIATGYVLTKCHAKVMAIDGTTMKLAVVSSAKLKMDSIAI